MRRLAVMLLAIALASCRHVAPSVSDGPGQRDAVRTPAHRLEANEREDAPDAAESFFRMKRGIVDGVNVQERYAAARAQIEHSRLALGKGAPAVIPLGAWSFLGPGNIGGRTRSLVIDPTDPNIMFAGGISGGVWKSSDGGASWSPVADMLANLAVSSLAMAPDDSRTIYAATGEGYFREDVRGTALPIRGDGIFVTRDAGLTWQRLTAAADPDFEWVNKVVVSPHDSRRVYAAARSGVWRSLDRGTSWSRVLSTSVKGGCIDLAFQPGGGDDDLGLVSCGIFEPATVYRNARAQSGDPWTSALSDPNMSRTSIAFAPSNPSVVYALAASNAAPFNQGLLAVYRSDQGGAPGTWNAQLRNDSKDRISVNLLTNPIAALETTCGQGGGTEIVNMGWHCNVITVDPTNPDRVWAAGVDLFRSDDGGRSWALASYWWADPDQDASFVHADQHAIVFHPRYDGAGNQTMFATDDGGVYRTDNANATLTHAPQSVCSPESSSVHFVTLNHHYGVTQFYHGAVFPDGATFIGGAQDNGTVRGTVKGGVDGWTMVNGGDGGYVAVDPVNPQLVYSESQYGFVSKSLDGGQTFKDASTGLASDSFLFIAPYVIDPNNHDRLWIGGTRVSRSDDGARQWLPVSAPMSSGTISAIAVANGSDRVLTGTNSGLISRNDHAGDSTPLTVWASTKPRDGYVSSITFDRSSNDVAYATYAGFGGTHVWKTIDGGASWSPLDGSGDGAIPDIPVHSLAIDPTFPSRMFLGTDLGIFTTLDGGAHWTNDASFAQVITESITIGQGTRGPALFAFTHGRGVWRVELTVPPRRRPSKS